MFGFALVLLRVCEAWVLVFIRQFCCRLLVWVVVVLR